MIDCSNDLNVNVCLLKSSKFAVKKIVKSVNCVYVCEVTTYGNEIPYK